MRIDISVINCRLLECLIKVGAFDSMGHTRSQLLEACENLLQTAQARHKERQSGQSNLFDAFDEVAAQDPSGLAGPGAGSGGISYALKDIPEVSDKQRLEWEKELVGYYVSGHPLDAYRTDMESFRSVPLVRFQRQEDGAGATVVGMVAKIVLKTDRNGGTMAFVEVADLDASIEVIFFSRTFEKVRDYIAVDQVLLIDGRVTRRSDEEPCKLIANDVKPIEAVREKNTVALQVILDLAAARNGLMDKLATVLKKSPGKKPVRLLIPKDQDLDCEVNLEGHVAVSLSNELVKSLANTPGVKALKFIPKE